MSDEARAVAACRDIKGWLTDAEAAALYQLGTELGPQGSILEIGSFHGKSTVVLGLAAQSVGSQVVAVDPHEGITYWQGDIPPLPHLGGPSLDSLQDNLTQAGVAGEVEIVVATSEEAHGKLADREPFAFIFVDGNHGYDSVRQDFDLWSERLMYGGVISFHDSDGTGMPGPPRVVAEVADMPGFERISTVDALTSFRRLA